MAPQGEPAAPPARRGRPPALNRAQILATARSLGTDVTMKALAQELGVDRKTLSRHVTDRQRLQSLVASDVFHEAMETVDLHASDDWREAVRRLGHAMRAGFLQAGTLAEHVQVSWVDGPTSLARTELFLQKLEHAGLPSEDGVRVLVLLAGIALASTRDIVLAQGSTHRVPEVEAVLDQTPAEELPAVRRAIHIRSQGPDEEQFEFELTVLIDGLAHRLTSPAT